MRGQHFADPRNSRFVPARLTMTTKRETRHSATSGPPLPTSPPASPKSGRCGGRGEDGSERLPRAARRAPARACPGLHSHALQGFQDEAAASMPLHFSKNVQSPGRWRTPARGGWIPPGTDHPGHGIPSSTEEGVLSEHLPVMSLCKEPPSTPSRTTLSRSQGHGLLIRRRAFPSNIAFFCSSVKPDSCTLSRADSK